MRGTHLSPLLVAVVLFASPAHPLRLPSLAVASTTAAAAARKASQAVRESPAVAAGSFVAGVATGVVIGSLQDAMEVYFTANDIPGGAIRSHSQLSGRVVAVSDGDTIRVRHTPTPLSRGTFAGKLSENTIAFRIAAVGACARPRACNRTLRSPPHALCAEAPPSRWAQMLQRRPSSAS